jgi:uncharacterized membrane protein YdbT with pleckstrin-like domain
MSYVQQVLQPGETIRYQTDIHWMIYLPGLALLVVAAALYVWSAREGAGGMYWLSLTLCILALAGAVILLFSAWFKRWTTEVAVTDRRIIYKEGFIRRRTIEMHMDKVESVDVEQSILGRMFNYGDILVRGVGTGFEPLKNIDSPLEFRNHVTAE